MQILEFAEQEYKLDAAIPCAVTGHLVQRADAHVDHSSPTFLALAEDFAAQCGGWPNLTIIRADGSIGVQLADPIQAKAWRDYHRDHARLRIVSVEANLSLLRRGVKRIK